MADLWNYDEPINKYAEQHDDLDFPDVPPWIEPDITPNDVAAIVQGGCASGAYMPAVTYHQALETMGEHGDDVLQYIDDAGLGEVLDAEQIVSNSWAGIAVYFLSVAVEAWARSVEDELSDALDAMKRRTTMRSELLDTAVDILRNVEWISDPEEGEYCPECLARPRVSVSAAGGLGMAYDHKPDCRLAYVLARAGEEEAATEEAAP